MKLKSKLTKIAWPENKEFNYKLSGLGGSGELSLTFGVIADQYSVHVKCTAKVSILASFHFEGLSVWEKTDEGFDFLTYEEKDFSKNIHKKWEMLADGLNYIENKKGLVLEREVQYFNTPENISTIFDPISAATVALIENPNRDVNIFGKQRILQLKTQKQGNELKIETLEGLNPTWMKILSGSQIILSDENIIQETEVPSPIQIGKLKMKFSEEKSVNEQSIASKITEFRKEN
ncbi:MAG: hypothetical protein V4596_04720 [Bdellovibrionota bacterium]